MKKLILLVLITGLAAQVSPEKPANAASSNASAWAGGSSASSSADTSSPNSASATAIAGEAIIPPQVIIEIPPEDFYQETAEYSFVQEKTETVLNSGSNDLQVSALSGQDQPETNPPTTQEISTQESLTARVNEIQNKQDNINTYLSNLETWANKSQNYYLIGLLLIALVTVILIINSIALRRRVAELEV